MGEVGWNASRTGMWPGLCRLALPSVEMVDVSAPRPMAMTSHIPAILLGHQGSRMYQNSTAPFDATLVYGPTACQLTLLDEGDLAGFIGAYR